MSDYRIRILRYRHRATPVERTLWFKYILEDEQTCVASLEELSALLDLYVERNDEELKQLRARHRKGQPRPKGMFFLVFGCLVCGDPCI